MSYATVVLLAGLVVLPAIAFAPILWTDAPPERFRCNRRRRAIVLVLAFLAFAAAHAVVAEIERPEPELIVNF